MDILPNADDVEIPIRKFTEYALNPEKQRDKADAFKIALGYNLSNYEKLIDNIKCNIKKFQAVQKSDLGYGKRYQVIMNLLGENGNIAKVLTAWRIDQKTNKTRLISVYVDE